MGVPFIVFLLGRQMAMYRLTVQEQMASSSSWKLQGRMKRKLGYLLSGAQVSTCGANLRGLGLRGGTSRSITSSAAARLEISCDRSTLTPMQR